MDVPRRGGSCLSMVEEAEMWQLMKRMGLLLSGFIGLLGLFDMMNTVPNIYRKNIMPTLCNYV